MTERASELGTGLGASFLFHAAIIAGFLLLHGATQLQVPRAYRVHLIAAPQGTPAIGVVRSQPAPPTKAPPPTTLPRPPRPTTTPVAKPKPHAELPRQATVTAPPPTAVPKPATPAPTAGSSQGGKGADVAAVSTGNVDFQFPEYTNQIATAIILCFGKHTGPLVATVEFKILRDGTAPFDDIKLFQPSGSFDFNTDAKGAVNCAANKKAFGPLPAGYKDDALIVFFTFSPKTTGQ